MVYKLCSGVANLRHFQLDSVANERVGLIYALNNHSYIKRHCQKENKIR